MKSKTIKRYSVYRATESIQLISDKNSTGISEIHIKNPIFKILSNMGNNLYKIKFIIPNGGNFIKIISAISEDFIHKHCTLVPKIRAKLLYEETK